MSKEACIIKGNRRGLFLRIPTDLEFSEILAQLRARLMATQEFFAGATVLLEESTRSLHPEEKKQLERTVEEFGLVLESVEDKEQAEAASPAQSEIDLPQENTILIRRTLRSGQRLYYDGNVVILGDVNPGAEVVCTGDIIVLGALRGVAHAGAQGNWDATVFAFRLEPTQLRIANYISRSPDEKMPHPTGPELARVVANVIEIRSYS